MKRIYFVLAVFVTALFVLAIGATWVVAQTSDQASAFVDDKGKVSMLDYDEDISCDLDKETEITWNIAGLQGDIGCRRGQIARWNGIEWSCAEYPDVAALEARIAELEVLLQHFSRDEDEITISGANLHVVNGTGTTDGTPNALGNIIIGYNEESEWVGDTVDRSGSHMLVVGKELDYSSFGGLIAGIHNTTSGPYASVSGGVSNTASGDFASVSGGYANTASGATASVSGGYGNTASGDHASVSGGFVNTASGDIASVSGGFDNTASGIIASVSGGVSNIASGDSDNGEVASSVSGGFDNTASGTATSVSGGVSNNASGVAASVSGGSTRTASGDYDWVAGELWQDE